MKRDPYQYMFCQFCWVTLMMKKRPTNTYTLNTGCSIPTSFRVVPTVLNSLFRWNLLPQIQHLYAYLVHLEIQLLQLKVPSPIPSSQILLGSLILQGLAQTVSSASSCPFQLLEWVSYLPCSPTIPHILIRVAVCFLAGLWSSLKGQKDCPRLHTPLAPTWKKSSLLISLNFGPFVSPTVS